MSSIEPAIQTPVAVDLCIDAEWIIPIEPAGSVLRDHTLVVSHGRIADLLPTTAANERYQPVERRDLGGHVLLPGLVNLHTHAAMSLLRGFADDLPLERWLQEKIWPAEARYGTAEFVSMGSLLACLEMISGGVTCFNDMYFFPEQTIEAAAATGIRAAIGIIVIDFPTVYAQNTAEYFEKGAALYAKHSSAPLLSFCLAPHAPYSVSDEGFRQVVSLATQHDLPIHVHLHETRREIEESLALHGGTPLNRLDHLGAISDRTIAVHGVYFTDEEMSLLAERQTSVAHCPVSNLKLASGIANIPAISSREINWGLGTDGAASNNRLDIWQELRQAALLAKVTANNAGSLNAHEVLRAATLSGAKALKLDHEIGSLSIGKSADLCAVKLSQWINQPCFDPASHLVYVTGREDVTDVWIAGKCRKNAGQIVDLSRFELLPQLELWHTRLISL
jgi:5-methylthioadenosine/S-adenosylhomocysteine deaminase